MLIPSNLQRRQMFHLARGHYNSQQWSGWRDVFHAFDPITQVDILYLPPPPFHVPGDTQKLKEEFEKKEWEGGSFFRSAESPSNARH